MVKGIVNIFPPQLQVHSYANSMKGEVATGKKRSWGGGGSFLATTGGSEKIPLVRWYTQDASVFNLMFIFEIAV